MNLVKVMQMLSRWGFILMWIPFATMFVGMFSLPEGDYSWGELPLLARGSMIAAGGLFILSVVGLLGSLVLGSVANRSILANGEPGSATILKIWDTGTTINRDPVVRMLLEVQPASGSPFQAETEMLVSRLEIPQIQPGTVVSVKFDPTSKAVALVPAKD